MAAVTGRSGRTVKKAKQVKLPTTDLLCSNAAGFHFRVSIPLSQDVREEAASTAGLVEVLPIGSQHFRVSVKCSAVVTAASNSPLAQGLKSPSGQVSGLMPVCCNLISDNDVQRLCCDWARKGIVSLKCIVLI